ncbi:DNAJ heat shock N-terminal domain-containing protein [Actinidia rufa]|uniref:DNAJ heat shock N-terminal domain-containing protein n=1 Tax=Actinidia rufa TaxID=165716 RepID=A0A7J0GDW8_9ERIC|nr:DNAJ heat shock N-terminal domain-containing protein [Actinidia rufa]
MECNKEEAIRAKQIAENKMQNKDFVWTRKIVLKAQKLDHDLVNISQMIMVCDVHCSAENKVFGNEKDWYGILKIELTADKASIKKQYRKFALLLHPDKNRFAGAADALKLIGEAQRTASTNPNVGKQPWTQNHFMSKGTSQFTSFSAQHQQAQRQPQTAFPNGQQTFCPFCFMRCKEGRSHTYVETAPFSHKLKVEYTGEKGEKDEYAIFPRKDEVWALYKNWNAGRTCSDLESCEYYIEIYDVEIKVLVLELVHGFKTVFTAQMRQGSQLTMKFPQKELLRFSHQIPAFRLTEERGGSLRGYWEPDPAALPVNLLSST